MTLSSSLGLPFSPGPGLSSWQGPSPTAGVACPAWPGPWLPHPLWLHIRAPNQAGSEEQGGDAGWRNGHSSGICDKTSRCQFLLLWGSHPHFVPTFLIPCISLEGGFMSSCLRNALKMRSTEHFPNSPQFSFSVFSLGCQASVFIFINSDHWLLPFLSRKLHLQLDLATIHGAGLNPISPDQHIFPHSFHYCRPPSMSLVCFQCHRSPCCQDTHLSKLVHLRTEPNLCNMVPGALPDQSLLPRSAASLAL